MEADYVVVRPAADLPAGFLPPHLDGRWCDRATMRRSTREPGSPMPSGLTVAEAVAVPAGRFEVRDDGAVAEVWEVAP